MKEKMEVALRVLTAIRERAHPLQLDTKALKSWVAPHNRFATPNDLACMVIFAEVQLRPVAVRLAAGERVWRKKRGPPTYVTIGVACQKAPRCRLLRK